MNDAGDARQFDRDHLCFASIGRHLWHRIHTPRDGYEDRVRVRSRRRCPSLIVLEPSASATKDTPACVLAGVCGVHVLHLPILLGQFGGISMDRQFGLHLGQPLLW